MSNATVKEEDKCEYENSIRELIRIGIKSKIIDGDRLIDFIYGIEED